MTTARQETFSMLPIDYIRSGAEKESVVGEISVQMWKLKK
jgi:hypothetical protein